MDPATDPHINVPKFNANGILKKTHFRHPPPSSLYRECLKNHAASLGGHAVDGCGEFMPSPSSDPSDPSSLTCAACGCHRNFHRRLPHPLPQEQQQQEEGDDYGDDRVSSQNDDVGDGEDNDHSISPPPPSATRMLLALSTGTPSAGPTQQQQQQEVGATMVGVGPRKRFRTKFSPEQKGRMQELSERMGWRMQRRDEGMVEKCCRELGITRGVFKVWMHNNKHNFVGPNAEAAAKRAEAGAGAGAGEAAAGNANGSNNGEGGIEDLGMRLNGSA